MTEINSGLRYLGCRILITSLRITQNHLEIHESLCQSSEKEGQKRLQEVSENDRAVFKELTNAAPAAAAAIRPMKSRNSSNLVE